MQVESKFTLSSKLSVEGPLRMKEEYVEGFLDLPSVVEEAVPDQLRGPLGQAAGAHQQLPVTIRDVISSGIRIPLSKHFKIFFATKVFMAYFTYQLLPSVPMIFPFFYISLSHFTPLLYL